MSFDDLGREAGRRLRRAGRELELPSLEAVRSKRRLRGGMSVGATLAVVAAAVASLNLLGGSVVDDTPAATTIPPSPDEVQVVGESIVLPPGLSPTDLAGDADRLVVLTVEELPSGGQPPQDRGVVVALQRRSSLEVAPEIVWRTELGDAPLWVAVGEGAVWVAHWATGAVTRLDPATGEVEAVVVPELHYDFGSGPDRRRFVPSDLQVGLGSVWLSTARGAVARIDPATATVTAIIELTPAATWQLAVGRDAVWVAEDFEGLTRIDAATNRAATVAVGHRALRVAEDAAGVIWIAGTNRATAVDPETLDRLGTVDIDGDVRYIGYLFGFFGALDRDGVFHHLSSWPPMVTRATVPRGGDGRIATTSVREGWLIESPIRRLTLLTEGPAAAPVELPFAIEDPTEERPIPPELAASEDWVRVDGAPIEMRRVVVAAWTGTELVLWHGGSEISGAAYNPSTGQWRSLPGTPLAVSGPGVFPGWVWTGDALLIWANGRAAAWDPVTNTWDDLGDIGLTAGSFHRRAVWTGNEVIDTLANVAFDPETGTNRPIAPPRFTGLDDAPMLAERSRAVWTGTRVVLLPQGGSYDPDDDTWHPIRDSGLSPNSSDGVWVGERLVAVDYLGHAAAFDPGTGAWEPLPHLPLLTGEIGAVAHRVAGTAVVEYGDVGLIYDGPNNTWIPFAGPLAAADQPHRFVPAGDHLYAYGPSGLYRLRVEVDRAWSQIRRASVGLPLDVPAGWTLGPGVTGISVTLTSPAGDGCLVQAFRASAHTILGRHAGHGLAVEVTPRIGGKPYRGLHVAPGNLDDRHHLFWALQTHLVIHTVCDSRTDAETVLAHFVWGRQ